MSRPDGGVNLSPEAREGSSRRSDGDPRKKRQENATTGATAAGIRAVSARLLTFYFRAPMKAFMRTRVDYMVCSLTLYVTEGNPNASQGYVRAINPRVQAQEKWSWRTTSPALLAHAIRRYGWSFIPNQVLPPLVANATVGAVLYTSYLQTLGALHEPSAHAVKRVYPPPDLSTSFTAGLVAGTIQSVIAAPLDALQVRFQANDMLSGKYKTMYHYAFQKSIEIGPRGIFAGFSLSFLKDSFGYGAFFATFEYLKSQAFYGFVSSYYGHYGKLSEGQQRRVDAQSSGLERAVIRPHYMLEPAFILLAGIAASITQQAVQYPLSKIQEVHYGRVEAIDFAPNGGKGGQLSARLYTSAYRRTLQDCLSLAAEAGGLRRWLYGGFLMGTLRQVPSTSAGLIVFEVLRRKYSNDEDAVKIRKDGYDILLP
ncbi:hypothetical protein MBLNU230_g6922t1 [Neophaeotheca triangularis]